MRKAMVLVCMVLLTACSSSHSGPAAQSPSQAPSPSPTTTLTGSLGSSRYQIEVPAAWNGTLFLYSHGYAAPGRPNPATDAPVRVIASWLLDHGYAIAGSSYSSTGWALEDAFKDQMALLDLFDQRVSKPQRVIAWGVSLGGIITAGLVQLHPDRFAGAIPLCGVVAGGIANWNAGLDAAYAFKTLLAPTSNLKLVGITDPTANLQAATDAFSQAAATPAGQARIALIAALAALPGWFDPSSPQPAPADYVSQATAQSGWESTVDFPFEFGYRAELEQRAGGNPSWNTGVDYAHQLAISADRAEVVALYRAARLDLAADLRALNNGARIKPDAQAAAYLDRNISFDGKLSVPVLTMHTTGDGLVVPQNETAFADMVRAAGRQALLRQVFVHRAGHCAFSAAETIALVQVMIDRLDTGHWDDAALQPGALDAQAQALGDAYNTIGGLFAATPAFTTFAPGPFPRPFDAGSVAPA